MYNLKNFDTLRILNFKSSLSDVPTPPENVSVSDIFKDSCLLHWEPPQDDGGTPLTHYLIEQMDVSSTRGAWREVGEVVADIRTFKCQHLEEKSKYKFRIRAINKIGQSEPADLQETVLAKDPWGECNANFERK